MREFLISLLFSFNLFAQITYQDQADHQQGGANPQTVSTVPSGTNSCWVALATTSSARTISSVTDDGAGLTWNEVYNITSGSQRVSAHVAYGTQGSTFDLSYAFNLNSPINVVVLRYTGVDGTTPTEGATTATGSDDTPTVTQSGGSFDSGDLYITGTGVNSAATVDTPDANYTERFSVSLGSYNKWAGEDDADGTPTHTLSTSGDWGSGIFILNAASTSNPSRGRIIIID